MKDGAVAMALISHPAVDDARTGAIAHFLENGCAFVPDAEDLPPWVTGLDASVVREIMVHKIELVNIYLLRIPQGAQVSLNHLSGLPELKDLRISTAAVGPADMRALRYARRLEILIAHGGWFTDDHITQLPALPALRTVDIQGTRATPEGAAELKQRFPKAEVYSAGRAT
jgi:hypothetical protein